MEVGDSYLLIGVDPQGILDQQLRPCPIHLLNIITIIINQIKWYIILLLSYFFLNWGKSYPKVLAHENNNIWKKNDKNIYFSKL